MYKRLINARSSPRHYVNGKWGFHYYVEHNGKRTHETKFLEATNRKEAEAERDQIITRWFLEGDTEWKTPPIRLKRATGTPDKRFKPVKADHADDGIVLVWRKIRYYYVYVKSELVGKAHNKPDARRIRDEYMQKTRMRLCAICGKRPVWKFPPGRGSRGGNSILVHDEKGCSNKVRLTQRDTKAQKIDKWNGGLYTGLEV